MTDGRETPFPRPERLDVRIVDLPAFFHYVDVGPHVRDDDPITDVHLPPR